METEVHRDHRAIIGGAVEIAPREKAATREVTRRVIVGGEPAVVGFARRVIGDPLRRLLHGAAAAEIDTPRVPCGERDVMVRVDETGAERPPRKVHNLGCVAMQGEQIVAADGEHAPIVDCERGCGRARGVHRQDRPVVEEQITQRVAPALPMPDVESPGVRAIPAVRQSAGVGHAGRTV